MARALSGVFLAGLCMCGCAVSNSWQVASPGGNVTMTVALASLGWQADYPAAERLYYKVDLAGRALIPFSPLGIVRQDAAFVDGLAFVRASGATEVRESYAMPHGKRRVCRNDFVERTLTFANARGEELALVVRAYDDGVAFRYVFPGTGEGPRTVVEEATGFSVPANSRAWMQPYDEASQWTPAYEPLYENGIAAGSPSPKKAGWAYPALFQIFDPSYAYIADVKSVVAPTIGWAFFTEAAVDGTYCGTRFAAAPSQNVYRLRMPDEAEGNGVGAVLPTSTLPWTMPWRVIIAGRTLAPIVESTLVLNLNPPSALGDTSWIAPGRVSWSWWSDHDSPKSADKLNSFVDLAKEMGWEYTLIDANWNIMQQGSVEDVLDHARAQGVGALLWYNSGGPHNIVTEAPRDRMTAREARRAEFARLREWGVKGVKVDFFQSDKQNIMQLYHDILKDAAEFRMLVNFHGCTLPRGWSRTYPHLLAMEAVRGAECYTFDKEYPAAAFRHNTILPFTRNVVGPMDYTPVAFTNGGNESLTTWAHELALAVVFECGLVHFADRVSAFRDLPEPAKDFLRAVPVAWDDTRFVAGEPGSMAVIARRRGNDWYVGGINGLESPSTGTCSLGFLDEGSYTLTRIGDGAGGKGFAVSTGTVTRAGALGLDMLPHGGFAAMLVKK
ncbi:MAG TPA: alpha-glucosidase [Planctomycetes bacterium]|nr:alpha-glucosidase [Planctomycetota bacterium]